MFLFYLQRADEVKLLEASLKATYLVPKLQLYKLKLNETGELIDSLFICQTSR